MKIIAIVVTYNRKKLLEKCIFSILNQTTPPEKIIIIDNASTDGTQSLVKEKLYEHRQNIKYVQLTENLGGAGGFSKGIELAIEENSDWVWIMDDDALPDNNALEELVKIVDSTNNLYGSIAREGETTSWFTTLLDSPKEYSTRNLSDIPASAKVRFLPFLGLLISKETVRKIGLPDESYFIAADDVEYCLRAQKYGSDIIVAGNSRINHPKCTHYTQKILFTEVGCLELSPWKRYYDTRNRLLNAKKYSGIKWIFLTIPGSLVRQLGVILREPHKIAQTYAFFAGLIDGIFGIKGKRHIWWRIKQ